MVSKIKIIGEGVKGSFTMHISVGGSFLSRRVSLNEINRDLHLQEFEAKMLRLLLLVLLFLSTSADFMMDLKIIKACNETSPISMETMNTVLIHQKLDDHNSNAFKCFLHCLFTKYGWMDEDGGFMIHQIKTGLDEAQLEFSALEYVLYKCTASTSVDKCERSFGFTECFWDRILPKNRNKNVKDEFLYRVGEKK